MTAILTSTGIGSGLDIKDLVDKLVDSEGQPRVAHLDKKESDTNTKISAFGTLKSALSTFQSTAKTLSDPGEFRKFNATSSNTSYFTASANKDATPGSYTVRVTQLAKAHKLTSVVFPDTTSSIGGGDLTIAVGSDNFTIDVSTANSNDTLASLRSAINNADDNPGVVANIITADAGSYLVLTAEDTGTNSEITVTVDDDDTNDTDTSGLSRLVYDPDGTGTTNMTESQAALDSTVDIDGQTVTSQSNTVTTALNGVTLDLLQVDAVTNYTLTISDDKASVNTSVETFVNAFNDMVDVLNTLDSYDSDTGATGDLFSDFTLATVRRQISNTINVTLTGIKDSLTNLADIGITRQLDGKLSIDYTTFDLALDTKLDAVVDLFTTDNTGTSNDGFMHQFEAMAEGFTANDGILNVRSTALQGTLDDISDDRVKLEEFLQKLETRLKRKFNAMDKLVAQLNSTGDFIKQQAEAFAAMNKN